jgi:hypothetical protein
MSERTSSAGKGDRARNNHSSQFRSNYNQINWDGPPKEIVESFKKTREKIQAALEKQPSKVTLQQALEQTKGKNKESE